jgi:hypothetical protein
MDYVKPVEVVKTVLAAGDSRCSVNGDFAPATERTAS